MTWRGLVGGLAEGYKGAAAGDGGGGGDGAAGSSGTPPIFRNLRCRALDRRRNLDKANTSCGAVFHSADTAT